MAFQDLLSGTQRRDSEGEATGIFGVGEMTKAGVIFGGLWAIQRDLDYG